MVKKQIQNQNTYNEEDFAIHKAEHRYQEMTYEAMSYRDLIPPPEMARSHLATVMARPSSVPTWTNVGRGW